MKKLSILVIALVSILGACSQEESLNSSFEDLFITLVEGTWTPVGGFDDWFISDTDFSSLVSQSVKIDHNGNFTIQGATDG